MRKAKLISTSEYSTNPRCPRNKRELILRQVSIDEQSWYKEPRTELPRAIKSPLKKSVGLLNLFKTALLEFRP